MSTVSKTLCASPFSITLPGHIQLKQHQISTREGLILSLLNDDGSLYAQGECSPLPYYSKESLADVSSAAKQLNSIEIPSYIDAIDTGKFPQYSSYPSLQWAIESAILCAQLRHLKGSLLNTQPLLQSVEDLVSDRFIVPTHGIVKVKCGKQAPSVENKKLIQALAQHPTLRLRCDVNNRLSYEDALRLFKSIEPSRIDYVEDPCKDPLDYERFFSNTGIPYALEAHALATIAPKALKGLKAIIYKTTLMGSLAHYHEIKSTFKHCDIIFSSCFESEIGLNALATVATQLSKNTVHGLGTGRYVGLDTNNAYWCIQ